MPETDDELVYRLANDALELLIALRTAATPEIALKIVASRCSHWYHQGYQAGLDHATEMINQHVKRLEEVRHTHATDTHAAERN